MKYDDASWHYGGDFPADLPDEAGGTHTGLYLAWALLSGLAGEIHQSDFAAELEALKNRRISPGAYFLNICDGKFTDEDLSDEGNAFTQFYFDFQKGKYLLDYEEAFLDGLPSLYHVIDSWENFDKIRPILDQRFQHWRVAR